MKTNQDPFEYVECYKNLVDSFPTAENMIELTNAYLKIQVMMHLQNNIFSFFHNVHLYIILS